jgi:hypothetical protein
MRHLADQTLKLSICRLHYRTNEFLYSQYLLYLTKRVRIGSCGLIRDASSPLLLYTTIQKDSKKQCIQSIHDLHVLAIYDVLVMP